MPLSLNHADKRIPKKDVQRFDGCVREVRVAPAKRSTNCLKRKIIIDLVDSSQLWNGKLICYSSRLGIIFIRLTKSFTVI
jgi:hypothetical protein